MDEYFAQLYSYEARREYEEWLDREMEKEWNETDDILQERLPMGKTIDYFKIVRADGAIFDIVAAENSQQAHDESHPDWLVRMTLQVKPATQDEWWTWRTMNWSQIDSMEREMAGLDRF